MLGLVLLGGCGPTRMSNERIIEETKKCEAAGLRAGVRHQGLDFVPVDVECEPR